MNYLLDTHMFLWVLFSPEKLSSTTKAIFLDSQSVHYISVITFWEISLKYQLQKLELKGVVPDELPALAKESNFEILPLDADTVSSFYRLPKLENKDPFDRMLIWQSIDKDFRLISKDASFKVYEKYGLKIVW